MAVLVACEESQAVTKAFRDYGIEAYSCDIEPCSGGHMERYMKPNACDLTGTKKYGRIETELNSNTGLAARLTDNRLFSRRFILSILVR